MANHLAILYLIHILFHTLNGQHNYLCEYNTKFTTNSVASWSWDSNTCYLSTNGCNSCGAVVWLADLLPESLLWTDYTIITDLKINSGISGVIFRATDIATAWDSGKYYFVAIKNSADTVAFGEIHNTFGFNVIKQTGTHSVWYNTYYELKIIVTGNSFDVYLDNSFVYTATDDTFTVGSIGLRSYGSIVTFKTLNITLPTQSPTTNTPTTYIPTNTQPTTYYPTTNQPTTTIPTTQQPTTSLPTTIPTTYIPTTYTPTTQQPTTSLPTTNIPTTFVPTTNMPSTYEPTTNDPTTIAPTVKMTTPAPILEGAVGVTISTMDLELQDALNNETSESNLLIILLIVIVGICMCLLLCVFIFVMRKRDNGNKLKTNMGKEITQVTTQKYECDNDTEVTEMVEYVNNIHVTDNGMMNNRMNSNDANMNGMIRYIDSNSDVIGDNEINENDSNINSMEYNDVVTEDITPNGDEYIIGDDEFVIEGETANHVVTKGN